MEKHDKMEYFSDISLFLTEDKNRQKRKKMNELNFETNTWFMRPNPLSITAYAGSRTISGPKLISHRRNVLLRKLELQLSLSSQAQKPTIAVCYIANFH